MKEWIKHLENKKEEETLDKISKLRIGDYDGDLQSIYAIEDKINEIIDVINTKINKQEVRTTGRFKPRRLLSKR